MLGMMACSSSGTRMIYVLWLVYFNFTLRTDLSDTVIWSFLFFVTGYSSIAWQFNLCTSIYLITLYGVFLFTWTQRLHLAVYLITKSDVFFRDGLWYCAWYVFHLTPLHLTQRRRGWQRTWSAPWTITPPTWGRRTTTSRRPASLPLTSRKTSSSGATSIVHVHYYCCRLLLDLLPYLVFLACTTFCNISSPSKAEKNQVFHPFRKFNTSNI